MNPKISVVIPVHNGMPFITEAIESVLTQEGCVAHEIIVVDDGSTDETPVLLDAFGDRIIRRRIAASGGPAEPRNVGMRIATGDWIAFLDADDLWMKHKLRCQAQAMEKYPQVGFICTNFLNYDASVGRDVDHYRILQDRLDACLDRPLTVHPLKLLLWHNFVGTSTVLIQKETAERVGFFNRRYVNSQDFDYWARASFLTKFLLVSEVLAERRRHSRNWSGDPFATPNAKKLILNEFLSDHCVALERDALVGEVRSALARNNYRLGTLYFENGEKRRAFAFYWEGFLYARTPMNFLKFCRVFFSKLLRSLTGDLASRKNVKRFFKS